MKIGILTFHCAHNYGAVLQAYGLQEYLKKCGNEVEIIDYRPEYLTRAYETFPRWRVNHKRGLFANALRFGYYCARVLPVAILRYPMRRKRWKKFEASIAKNLNLSGTRFCAPQQKIDGYDAIVFGSDQIWSPNHTNGGDKMFVGDFVVPAGTLKIAYAASAGAASETLGGNAFFTDALKHFDALSVREQNLADALQAHLPAGTQIATVLDPTLLAGREIWEKFARTPQKMPKKFVLVYQVMYKSEANRIAREIATQIGAEVVEIAAYNFSGNQRKTESPEEFVGWFKNAACVVTTSFHGTAFSLIFEKPFYFVGNGNAAENRPRQILGALGLMERFIAPDARVRFSNVDFSAVAARMGGGGGAARPSNERAHVAFRRLVAQNLIAGTPFKSSLSFGNSAGFFVAV